MHYGPSYCRLCHSHLTQDLFCHPLAHAGELLVSKRKGGGEGMENRTNTAQKMNTVPLLPIERQANLRSHLGPQHTLSIVRVMCGAARCHNAHRHRSLLLTTTISIIDVSFSHVASLRLTHSTLPASVRQADRPGMISASLVSREKRHLLVESIVQKVRRRAFFHQPPFASIYLLGGERSGDDTQCAKMMILHR